MTTMYPQLLDLSVKYTVDHIPVYSHKRKGKISTDIPLNWEYITIHNTNNEATTAKEERRLLVDPNNTSINSPHMIIDDNQCIECVPLTEQALSCDDDINSDGNIKSINIKLCETGDIEKTIDNTAEIIALLLLLRGKTAVDALKQHNDWTGKNCPRLLRKDNNRLYNLLIEKIAIKTQLLSSPQTAYKSMKLPTNATLINNVFYFPLSILVKSINGTLTVRQENYKKVAIIKFTYNDPIERTMIFTLNEKDVIIGHNNHAQVHTMDFPVLMRNSQFIVPLKFILDLCNIPIKSFNGKTLVFVINNKEFSITSETGQMLIKN